MIPKIISDHERTDMEGSQGLRPRLSPAIEKSLESIEPSRCGVMRYFPCSVVLKDGRKLDCVYLVSQTHYIRYWGVYPEDDPGKSNVMLQDVETVTESPYRLPASIANAIYENGESGMGYIIFTLVFADRSKQPYLTGNAVDFVDYPEGKNTNDIVEVLPHVGRDSHPWPGRQYYWCLYSDDDRQNPTYR